MRVQQQQQNMYKKILVKDVRKFSFPDQAVDRWNILPEEVSYKNIHSFRENYNIFLKDGTQLLPRV